MINYQHIHDSISYYEKIGFNRVEAPWTVTKPVSQLTAPPLSFDWEIKNKDKVLVASGEQSFLYLYLKGYLPKGRFQAVTPCFRNEPFDSLHSKYFIKNELIETKSVNKKTLESIVNEALVFFRNYLPSENLQIVATADGFDIEFSFEKADGWEAVELGSYGIRECSFLKWIYGTGCAEPRLSQAIQHGISHGIYKKGNTR